MNPTRKFYTHKGIMPLGMEGVGTSGRYLDQLKTIKGVVRRNLKRGLKEFTIYQYTNFYDNRTFTKVYQQCESLTDKGRTIILHP